MKERIGYIDAAKAVGIWLVVMGHCSNTIVQYPYLVSFIYLFHMPLFFLISGYFFKTPVTIMSRPGGQISKKLCKPLHSGSRRHSAGSVAVLLGRQYTDME